MMYIYVCVLHFHKKFLKCNENRVRFINTMHLLPTIFPEKIEKKYLLPKLTLLRKPSTVRNFGEDEKENDTYIKLFINSCSLNLISLKCWKTIMNAEDLQDRLFSIKLHQMKEAFRTSVNASELMKTCTMHVTCTAITVQSL